MQDRIHHYILGFVLNLDGKSAVMPKSEIKRIAKRSTNSSGNDTLFDRRIEMASEGLSPYYSRCFYKIPLRENALT